MPPKKPEKSSDPEEPVGYNLDLMSLGQLKCYARLLEGEIEDMRKHCNFYQKMEDELVEMLRVTEDELRFNERSVILKDINLEKLKLDFMSHLKQKKEWPEYLAYTSATNRRELQSTTENRLEVEESRHTAETMRLQNILLEKDRELESLRVKIEMARKETQERHESDLKAMDEEQKRLLDSAIQRFDTIMQETENEFKKAKEMIECEASEARIMGERDLNSACEGFKRKLQDYYREVTRQDLDVVKKLKNAIHRVEENIKFSKWSLQQARNEFARLKADAKTRAVSSFSGLNKFDAGPLKVATALNVHNKTEKLALENQHLEVQIKNVVDQICSLRQQFTLALKKIRESAEKKAAILERKLNFILEERRKAPSSQATLESSSIERSTSEISTTNGSRTTSET